MQEQRRFPSQTLPNLRGVHELSYASEPAPKIDEVKTIITLRRGKKIDQAVPKPAGETREEEKVEPEHIFIKEDSMKKSMPSISPRTERQKEGLQASRHLGSTKAGKSEHPTA